MKTLNILVLSASLLSAAFSLNAAPVNVNQADANTISENLKGIGIIKANALVSYRETHGKFTTAESLSSVKGIGEKTIEKNKSDILL